ncbi:MAG: hypothetical protein ACRDP7_13455 [Trebonia sp.]
MWTAAQTAQFLGQMRGHRLYALFHRDAGRRVIALDTTTIVALREHQARQQAERAAAGIRWCQAGYVFTAAPANRSHRTG